MMRIGGSLSIVRIYKKNGEFSRNQCSNFLMVRLVINGSEFKGITVKQHKKLTLFHPTIRTNPICGQI